MNTILVPRPYQLQAHDALLADWAVGQDNLACVLPTGAGKTVIFAHLTKTWHERYSNRVLILVHTEELASQTYAKLRAIAPHLSIGIVKAHRNQPRVQVVIGSVQTLRNVKRRAQVKDVGLIIVDECHHAVAKTYQTILDHYPHAKKCGFSATLMRGDGKGLGRIWNKVSYQQDISWMVRHGYLLDPRGKRIEIPDLDLRNVKRSGYDFQPGALGEALTQSVAPEVVAKAYVEHASDRAGILFAPTVEAAHAFAEALELQGVKAEVVHGKLPDAQRRNALARFNDGTTQVICNCMVLTEGYDSPRANCIVIARPTRSPVLYVQMVGRGLRLYPGQTDCLILDVTGASQVHSLRSLVDLSKHTIDWRDGQSLTEAEDETQARQDAPKTVTPYYGPVTAIDFDPLARASKRTWLTTTGGTWYLPTLEAYVLIVESFQPGAEQDTYDVVWVTKDPRTQITVEDITGRWGVTSHVSLPLDLAFAWGEDLASELGEGMDYLNLKSAWWRRQKPSPEQLRACRMRRIDVTPGASRGDVSALLETWVASQVIDPAGRYFENKRRQHVRADAAADGA